MKNAPPPSGPPKASTYSRFIPREELGSVAAWNPGSLADGGSQKAQPGLRRASDKDASAQSALEEIAARLQAARQAGHQAGYQDGYRDGLVALEGFKQSFATQLASQIGLLVQSIGDQLDTMEQDMARCLADAATSLARQIVRSELQTRPELIEAVAREATESLLLSARHITLRVHPDDQPLVAQGAADVLAARGARLIADASIARGGCLVESDIGVLDATLQARWNRGVAQLGSEEEWETTAPGLAPALQPMQDEST